MKIIRRIAAALSIVLIALSAASCAKNGAEQIPQEQIRKVYQDAAQISAKAKIQTVADGGQEFEFVLQYDKNSDGEKVTVVQPEEISGIAVSFSSGDMLISENGGSFGDGLDISFKYTAANMLPQIFKTLANDMISDSCAEKTGDLPCTALSYNEKTPDVEYIKRIWIDNQTTLPKKAEIYADSDCVIMCEFLTAEIK